MSITAAALFWLLTLSVAAEEPAYTLRAFVPNRLLRQGEVRVVVSNGTVAVQTILYTSLPDRVIAGICGKEAARWKSGQEHFGDSQAYCAALKEIPAALRKRNNGKIKVYQWMIEFRHTPDADRVELRAIETSGDKERLRIAPQELLFTPQVPSAYIRKNMEMIMQDLFGKDEKNRDMLQRLIGQLSVPALAKPQ
ncbi:MAG: hypothetical protein NTV49_15170 [Kiritimatiellaeota bacterium]|nr:hypothetical protein [Kiritimatiellota bacterium]